MVDSILNIVEFRGVIAGLAADRHRGIGGPMVGIDPGDNMLLVLLATTVLVKMNQAVCGINSRRATAGQGPMVEIARSQFSQFGRSVTAGILVISTKGLA